MIRRRVPELEPTLAWLNTSDAISSDALQHQAVLFAFFTAHDVSSLQMLPALRALAARFPALRLVGVYRGRMPGDVAPARVEATLRRLQIDWPVVVDDDGRLAGRFGVTTWPTLLLASPAGEIAARVTGEPDPTLLAQLVAAELPADTPPALSESRPAPRRRPNHLLACPTRLAIAPDGRIALADEAHHRVLVLNPRGELLEIVGAGFRGFAEGTFANARFACPQGLAWDDQVLWVCDPGNHALLRIDFLARRVSVIAGTGQLGNAPLQDTRPANEVALRSPWDVVADDTHLFVALAGSHQVAVYDKAARTIGLVAGSGHAEHRDGPSKLACFAQPWGLWQAGATLYVSDAHNQAVRRVHLQRGEVDTVCGGPGAPAPRLPAQLAALPDGRLLLADAYDGVLRCLDVERGVLSSWYAGRGAHALDAPEGVAVDARGEVIVADTLAHRLMRLDAHGRSAFELGPRPEAALELAQ